MCKQNANRCKCNGTNTTSLSVFYETALLLESMTSLPFLLAGIMENMEKYDLTPTLCQYLDRHLVFPLLEFLSVKEVSTDHEEDYDFWLDSLSFKVMKIVTNHVDPRMHCLSAHSLTCGNAKKLRKFTCRDHSHTIFHMNTRRKPGKWCSTNSTTSLSS